MSITVFGRYHAMLGLCAGRDGHSSTVGERAGDFSKIQTIEDTSAASLREPLRNRVDLAKESNFTERSGSARRSASMLSRVLRPSRLMSGE
jgi:hypothetical protein